MQFHFTTILFYLLQVPPYHKSQNTHFILYLRFSHDLNSFHSPSKYKYLGAEQRWHFLRHGGWNIQVSRWYITSCLVSKLAYLSCFFSGVTTWTLSILFSSGCPTWSFEYIMSPLPDVHGLCSSLQSQGTHTLNYTKVRLHSSPPSLIDISFN